MSGWIGVDLDGTLAEYNGWKGELDIGAPIPAMVRRIKRWLESGVEVRIFTARVCDVEGRDAQTVRGAIETWCEEHVGVRLKVTNAKDYGMVELWDDRAFRVEKNTGKRIR